MQIYSHKQWSFNCDIIIVLYIKVGEWSINEKLNMYKDTKIVWDGDGSTEIPRDSVNALANKTITIVTFKVSYSLLDKDCINSQVS